MTTALTVAPDPKKLIRGDLIKINDGKATLRDGTAPPEQLLVTGEIIANRRWSEQQLTDVEVMGPDGLADVDELNEAIPQEVWEKGLDGKPRAPWERVYGFYFTDTKEAGSYTWMNSTYGARLAWERLNERIHNMSHIRGRPVAPIVRITGRPMKTSFGTRTRPEFEVVSWIEVGGSGPPPAAIAYAEGA